MDVQGGEAVEKVSGHAFTHLSIHRGAIYSMHPSIHPPYSAICQLRAEQTHPVRDPGFVERLAEAKETLANPAVATKIDEQQTEMATKIEEQQKLVSSSQQAQYENGWAKETVVAAMRAHEAGWGSVDGEVCARPELRRTA